MPENKLKALRDQIDEINGQILALLIQRAEVASEIGKVQQQLGTRFYDPQREAEMLQALEQANQGPFSNETIKALFKEVFRATLALEEQEADDLLLAIEQELRKRRVGGSVVRMEIQVDMPTSVREMLTQEMGLTHHEVYKVEVLVLYWL